MLHSLSAELFGYEQDNQLDRGDKILIGIVAITSTELCEATLHDNWPTTRVDVVETI